jgi:hypothetical protein
MVLYVEPDLDWSIYKIFRGCPDLLGDWIKDHEDETMTVKAAQAMVTAHKKALEDAATRGEEDEEEETAPAEETKDEETSETDKENSAEETQPLAAKDEEIEDGQAPGEDAAIRDHRRGGGAGTRNSRGTRSETE